MRTKGDFIAGFKKELKLVRQDAFVTDRSIYSAALKFARMFIRRMDAQLKLMSVDSVFQTHPFVELEDVDVVQASCWGLSSDCVIKRTKDKIPPVFEGMSGVLIRAVYTLGGERIEKVLPSTYQQITKQKNQKWNKTKYYWYQDGYLYFPNLTVDAVKVEAMWEDDINKYTCDGKWCVMAQDEVCNIPEALDADIWKEVQKDMFGKFQIPEDKANDKSSIAR